MTQAELTLSSPRATIAGWLTVERAAYGGVTLLALGLRLYGLGQSPLGPAEAAQALPAWQSATGRAFEAAGTSPLLFQLQRLFFIPFGGSDALPRWPAALLGGLAVLLFWGLRDRLGRGGALAAALLWAISPMAVFAGRLGLDYGLVPPLALALLAATNLYFRTGAGSWLVWATIALALLLLSGPAAYTVVLSGLIAAALWRARSGELLAGVRVHARPVALAAFLTLVLGATGLLTLPAGLASAPDLLSRWLRNLAPGGAIPPSLLLPGGMTVLAGYDAWDVARRLLISEPLLLGTAIVTALATWRRDQFVRLVALAAGVTLLLALLGPGRNPGDLGLLVMALCLLAGPGVAWVLGSIAGWRDNLDAWLLFGLSLALLTAVGISLPSAFRALPVENRPLFMAVGLVAFALCLGLWLLFGWWSDRTTSPRVLSLVLLVVGGMWGISQLVGINYQHEPNHYGGVLAEVPADGMQLLRQELSSLSGLYGSGRHEAPIDLWVQPALNPQAAAPGAVTSASRTESPVVPVLRWELKGYNNLRVVTAFPQSPASVVIMPLIPDFKPDSVPQAMANYSGSQYSILESWRPGGQPDLAAWVGWLLYRQAVTPPTQWQALLWIDRAGMPSGTGARAPFAPLAPSAPQGGGAVQ